MLPGLQKHVLLVLHIMMFSFLQNSVIIACDDTVITACNDTTTCMKTYEELYKLLGSSNNYFNIAKALYPAKWLPSVHVHVTLHGANGTENCRTAKYTWSMSCLFAAFPKYVLEVLSLGSILVTPRTQDLNITISPFCCNVSQEDRLTMIDTVLAALQDLAVSPGIQDPSLNTVECIVKGHEPNLTDTGRCRHIIATLWLSFIFSLFLGFWVAIYALISLDNVKGKIPVMYSALKWTTYLLLIVEFGLFITACVLSGISKTSGLFTNILPILIITPLVGFGLGIVSFLMKKPELEKCHSTPLKICIFVLANLTSYHFYWIVIGIMVNALWSVSVLLFVCVIVITLFFSLYMFFLSVDGYHRWICFTMCIPVLCLLAIVIVAGQTVFGRNTADDIVKTVILSVTIAFMKQILSTMKNDNSSKKWKTSDITAFFENVKIISKKLRNEDISEECEEREKKKGEGRDKEGEGEAIPLTSRAAQPYTDAVSFVNASVSMRLRHSFTRHRSSSLSEPGRSENAF